MPPLTQPNPTPVKEPPAQNPSPVKEPGPAPKPEELGGAKRLEPTRYGDWELNGKCVDF